MERFNPSNFVPGLAKSYKANNGRQTCEFQPCRRVKRQDDDPFTSTDVQANFGRRPDPDFRGKRGGSIIRPVVEKVITPDDYNVLFDQ